MHIHISSHTYKNICHMQNSFMCGSKLCVEVGISSHTEISHTCRAPSCADLSNMLRWKTPHIQKYLLHAELTHIHKYPSHAKPIHMQMSATCEGGTPSHTELSITCRAHSCVDLSYVLRWGPLGVQKYPLCADFTYINYKWLELPMWFTDGFWSLSWKVEGSLAHTHYLRYSNIPQVHSSLMCGSQLHVRR